MCDSEQAGEAVAGVGGGVCGDVQLTDTSSYYSSAQIFHDAQFNSIRKAAHLHSSDEIDISSYIPQIQQLHNDVV